MAVILAIDASIGISSCAIWQGGAVAAYGENRESSMQSARLMPLVEEVMAKAGASYKDLALVASTVGPGSFTGIRIGLAAARGIAFAASIPCVGYTTLEVMRAATGAPNALAIVNAGKGEVYYQYFGEHSDPAIGSMTDILARYPGAVIASSMPLPAGFATPAVTFPRADALAKLAATLPEAALPPSPFYIRPPDAKPQRAIPSVAEGS